MSSLLAARGRTAQGPQAFRAPALGLCLDRVFYDTDEPSELHGWLDAEGARLPTPEPAPDSTPGSTPDRPRSPAGSTPGPAPSER